MSATIGRKASPTSSMPAVYTSQRVNPGGVLGLTLNDTQSKMSVVTQVLHFSPAALGALLNTGTLVKVDTASKLTVVSNVLQFAGGKGSPAFGDPGAWGASSYARAAGRAVLLRVNRTSGTAMRFGWDTDQAGAPSIAIGLDGSGNIYAPKDDSGNLTDAVGSFTSSAWEDFGVILRAGGGHFVIHRLDDGRPWELLWVSDTGAGGPYYPAVSNYDFVANADQWREGDLGGLFATDYGIATGRVSGSVSINTFLTQTPDALVAFTVTTLPSAGSLSVEVRSSSAGTTNAWYLAITSTGQASFRKRINSVDTIMIPNTTLVNGTFTTNCRVVLKMVAGEYRIYVNGVLKGSLTGGSADTTFSTNTIAGVTNLGTGGVVSDFVTWPATLSIGTDGDPAGWGLSKVRAAGQTLRGTVNLTRNDQSMYLGWDTDQAGAPGQHATGFGSRGLLQVSEGGTIWDTTETYAASTDYQVLIALRSTGAFHLIKGGAYTSWTLFWVSSSLTASPLYPMLEAFAASGTFFTYQVPDIGTRWDTDYGIATGRLAGVVALDAWIPHLPDAIIRYTLTTLPSASTAAVSFRAMQTHSTVSVWYIPVASDGSGSLRERINSVDAIRLTFAAGTFTTGCRVTVVLSGTSYAIYVNNTLVGTYSGSSTLTTNVACGVTTLGTGGVISDLVSFPRYPVVILDNVKSTSIYAAQIVWDGDSLTWGYLGSPGADYPHTVIAALSQRIAWRNDAISGQTLAQMQADASTEIDPAYSTDYSKNVLILWGGTNDIALDGASAATAYSRLQTYCAARKAAGWTIVVLTMIPRGSTAAWEASRVAYNASIVANYRTFADVLVDLAADPVFAAGQQTNTTNYNGDQTHLTDAGYAYVGGLVTTALSALGVS